VLPDRVEQLPHGPGRGHLVGDGLDHPDAVLAPLICDYDAAHVPLGQRRVFVVIVTGRVGLPHIDLGAGQRLARLRVGDPPRDDLPLAWLSLGHQVGRARVPRRAGTPERPLHVAGGATYSGAVSLLDVGGDTQDVGEQHHLPGRAYPVEEQQRREELGVGHVLLVEDLLHGRDQPSERGRELPGLRCHDTS